MKTVIDSGSRVCDFVYVLGCGTGLLKGVSASSGWQYLIAPGNAFRL